MDVLPLSAQNISKRPRPTEREPGPAAVFVAPRVGFSTDENFVGKMDRPAPQQEICGFVNLTGRFTFAGNAL